MSQGPAKGQRSTASARASKLKVVTILRSCAKGLVLAGFLLGVASCLKDLPVLPPPAIVEYKFKLPPGKLAWPHLSPELTQDEYEKSLDSIWIINNCGEFQGGNNPADTATEDDLHDGLDIVVSRKGTHLFAVEAGYVIGASGGVVTISNKAEPSAIEAIEWVYVHVANYQVRVGQQVSQGQYLADEAFDGLDHVHLMRRVAGQGWNALPYEADPTTFENLFEYRDTEPPIIDSVFYFFRNNSNDRIRSQPDGSMVLSGDIDIVVGMREVGEYAHSHDTRLGQFGDRLAVTGAKCCITGTGTQTIEDFGFDFRTLNFAPPPGKRIASTMYKPHWLLSSDSSWTKRFSYYVLSNFDGTKSTLLRNIDPNNCWRTTMVENSGARRFPNGSYTITVTAWDAAGNEASASTTVEVTNP